MGKASNRKKLRRAGELWEGPNLDVLAAMEEPLRWLITQDGPGWNDDQDTPCRKTTSQYDLLLIEAGDNFRIISARTADGHTIATHHKGEGVQAYAESKSGAYAERYCAWACLTLEPDLYLVGNKATPVSASTNLMGRAGWAASMVAFRPPDGVEVTPLLEDTITTLFAKGVELTMSPSAVAVMAAAMIR